VEELRGHRGDDVVVLPVEQQDRRDAGPSGLASPRSRRYVDGDACSQAVGADSRSPPRNATSASVSGWCSSA
jgi:hypothetical protein